MPDLKNIAMKNTKRKDDTRDRNSGYENDYDPENRRNNYNRNSETYENYDNGFNDHPEYGQMRNQDYDDFQPGHSYFNRNGRYEDSGDYGRSNRTDRASRRENNPDQRSHGSYFNRDGYNRREERNYYEPGHDRQGEYTDWNSNKHFSPGNPDPRYARQGEYSDWGIERDSPENGGPGRRDRRGGSWNSGQANDRYSQSNYGSNISGYDRNNRTDNRGAGASDSYSNHRGKGPKGYQRSDEKIKEDISEQLSDHENIDASDIEVDVQNGKVTLTGRVKDKTSKRRIEDLAEDVLGVKNVKNDIAVSKENKETASFPSGSSMDFSAGTNKKNNTGSKARSKTA